MNAVASSPVSKTGAAYEKVVIVTRKTELEELTARFNSVPQAQFCLTGDNHHLFVRDSDVIC